MASSEKSFTLKLQEIEAIKASEVDLRGWGQNRRQGRQFSGTSTIVLQSLYVFREHVQGGQVACSRCLYSVNPHVLVKKSVRRYKFKGVCDNSIQRLHSVLAREQPRRVVGGEFGPTYTILDYGFESFSFGRYRSLLFSGVLALSFDMSKIYDS